MLLVDGFEELEEGVELFPVAASAGMPASKQTVNRSGISILNLLIVFASIIKFFHFWNIEAYEAWQPTHRTPCLGRSVMDLVYPVLSGHIFKLYAREGGIKSVTAGCNDRAENI